MDDMTDWLFPILSAIGIFILNTLYLRWVVSMGVRLGVRTGLRDFLNEDMGDALVRHKIAAVVKYVTEQTEHNGQ